jgi:hypothetical protein
MDPDESVPAPAAFSPPAAAPLDGPKIFQLSPLPGNIYDVDRFFYAPSADTTHGDFAALLAFATHHGHPLTVHACPDIAAFQVAYPSAIICPYSEVPAPLLTRGRDHFLASTAPQAPPLPHTPAASAAPAGSMHWPWSFPPRPSSSHSRSLLSSSSSLSRGADPPSVAAATRASPSSFSRVSLGFYPSPSQRCPNPDGLVSPFMDMGGYHHSGRAESSVLGRLPPQHGGRFASGSSVVTHHGGRFSSGSRAAPPPPTPFGLGFTSLASTAEQWHAFTFPGAIPEAVPSFVFGGDAQVAPPPHGGFPHAPASVASFTHEEPSSSSKSDITMSFGSPPSPPQMGVVSPGFPLTAPPLAPVPAASPSFAASSPPPAVSLRAMDPFKHPVIKDAKAYLNLHDIIQYYLCLPEYSTAVRQCPYHKCVQVGGEPFLGGSTPRCREGWFLAVSFDNKGTLFHGKGFEMLAWTSIVVLTPCQTHLPRSCPSSTTSRGTPNKSLHSAHVSMA